MSILPPDNYGLIQNLPIFEQILSFMFWLVKFYGIMFLCIVIQSMILIVPCWTLLVLCRLFGLTWIDGTKKGYLNRE